MMLDRGVLVQEGAVYRPTGPIARSRFPRRSTRSSRARLDGLPPAERRVLQDAAVLGKTFTQRALGRALRISRRRARAAARVARAQGDPRRAGRPALARARPVRVPPGPRASRRLRDAVEARAQARHLAAAAHLESALGEDEVVEVVASHYLDAYRAAPDADDAEAIKRKAREHARACG